MRDLGFTVAAGCTRTEAADLAGIAAGEEGGDRIRSGARRRWASGPRGGPSDEVLVAAAGVEEGDVVLEIGPGTGSLTAALL